jgi:hypothetical protein
MPAPTESSMRKFVYGRDEFFAAARSCDTLMRDVHGPLAARPTRLDVHGGFADCSTWTGMGDGVEEEPVDGGQALHAALHA